MKHALLARAMPSFSTYNTIQNAKRLKKIRAKVVNEYNFKATGPINNAILLPFSLRGIDVLKIGYSFVAHLPATYKISLVSIDKITVPAGEFTAYHFTSQPPNFEIWISCDADRLPLKIKSAGGYDYTMVMQNRVFNKK